MAATTYLDLDNPRLRDTAARVAGHLGSSREKAVALHDFVRDQVLFGFGGGFWDQRASEVLASGRGYCNTKSTLFVALLRAAGIPARQVFVDIDAAVLHGLLDPQTPYVDHSYVEAWIDGAWRATDSYIVDPKLFTAAQRRLEAEGRLLGYGVHATGTCRWDGLKPAFSQYNRNDPRPLGTRTWGVYEDVGAFYGQAPAPWNALSWPCRTAFGLLAAGANRRAEALRQAT